MDAELTEIDGLITLPLATISSEKGTLFHVLRSSDPIFERFGEVYVSMTTPGNIKGWKFHKTLVQNFAVPVGMMRFVFVDRRSDSPTRGKTATIEIGESNYRLLHVPAQLWYAFQTTSATPAYIVNCATDPHNPEESMVLPLEHPDFHSLW